jgi:YD repeat-containing protein
VDFEYALTGNIRTWDLQQIKIYNNIQALPVQTVSLIKGSFANGQKRLDKVTFTGQQGQNYDYLFGYNGEPGNSGSSGIDYWGYFNGSSVPYGKRYTPKFDNLPNGIQGTDRNANDYYMQRGILNKITYPTKGYSSFIYEAHKARYSLGTPVQTFGGLRIKEIHNYLPDGNLAEKKWYKYGENESGTGIANTYPDLNDFLTESRTLITYADNGQSPDLWWMRTIMHYSSFPKISYFISGSPVVYAQVTEYTGNDTGDYGKTVYRYEVTIDEKVYPYGDTYRWNSPDTYLRTYPWKTGKLLSKDIYKKEGDAYQAIHSLQNSYKDINKSEFRNVRVLSYVEFEYDFRDVNLTIPDIKKDFCNYSYHRQYFGGSNPASLTPYDYYNYYITTGQRVLESTRETIDGVTAYTYYDTHNEIGLPTRIREISSQGDSLTEKYTYAADSPNPACLGMRSANIMTPVIEKTSYKGGSLFLEKEIANYKFWHSLFYALENKQVQYQDGATDTRLKYGYDTKANIQEIVKNGTENVFYIWGYNYSYPIAEIRKASFSEIETAVRSVFAGVTIEGLSAQSTPNEAKLKDGSLQKALPNALVTTYTYKPLVGILTATDPVGITTHYDYDAFGRLKETYIYKDNIVSPANKQTIQKYDYHYKSQ